MEEDLIAGWLYRNLNAKVDEFIVSEPRRNKLIASEGDRDDKIDSGKLAVLLRGNFLKAVPSSLDAFLASRILNQDPSHCLRICPEEVAPTPPILVFCLYQPDISFVDKGRRLEGLSGRLPRQLPGSQKPQLLIHQIHQREQLSGSLVISPAIAFRIRVTSLIAVRVSRIREVLKSQDTNTMRILNREGRPPVRYTLSDIARRLSVSANRGKFGRLEAGDIRIAGAGIILLEGRIGCRQIRRVGVATEGKVPGGTASQVSYPVVAFAAEMRRVSQHGHLRRKDREEGLVQTAGGHAKRIGCNGMVGDATEDTAADQDVRIGVDAESRHFIAFGGASQIG